ncbi:Spore germination protein GerM [Paenibacillus plantiphilus]|uniref:Spore germination protein GerM n=1 Tax=Paenibacillus plantiphilus TaxID=2905650 RepID=A0ABN8GA66_9BACL|nr:GerMN domain-containing protein [Paenibacillus plantiphilus]CAH1204107.1 Spore germination protein GerM [Paenibacillus plantiphilus]
MNHYRLLRRTALAGVLALPILTTGCGLFSQEASQPIDPPQGNTGNAVSWEDNGNAVQPGEGTQLTVYYKDRNGKLAPVTVLAALGSEEKAGQKALEMMVEGGPLANEIPEGFQAVLPQGTQVIGYNVVADQKLAIVDFSQSFTDYNAMDERSIVEAVTWTLTGMHNIEKVKIWVDGQELLEMPVDGLPLDEPLTRAVGINLEAQEGINYSQSTPVTLYFSAVTPNDETYYVPITRLINRTDNRAKAAIEQLISGPVGSNELEAVMTPDVIVKNVTKKNDIATVELEYSGYEEGQQAPAEMMQALVLAMTENTGLAKVQIKINGKSNVKDTNNQSYSEPVSRPQHMNAFKS